MQFGPGDFDFTPGELELLDRNSRLRLKLRNKEIAVNKVMANLRKVITAQSSQIAELEDRKREFKKHHAITVREHLILIEALKLKIKDCNTKQLKRIKRDWNDDDDNKKLRKPTKYNNSFVFM